MIGRRYTWSNEQDSPTLVHLDRAFCNVDWELLFPAAKLLPQATSISDHCPLLLVNDSIIKTNRRFCFEAYWQYIDGFQEVVQNSWNLPTQNACPLMRLNTKLHHLSKALRAWSRTLVGDICKQLLLVNEMVLQLDTSQETRPLSQGECDLRSRLKSRTLGLSVLLKIKLRQQSRVLWLKVGDANTKFFQRKANARHMRNTIHVLHGAVGSVSSPDAMLDMAHQHF